MEEARDLEAEERVRMPGEWGREAEEWAQVAKDWVLEGSVDVPCVAQRYHMYEEDPAWR